MKCPLYMHGLLIISLKLALICGSERDDGTKVERKRGLELSSNH